MEMPWTDARDYLAAHARIRRDALLEAAVAARAALADHTGWKQWMDALNADG